MRAEEEGSERRSTVGERTGQFEREENRIKGRRGETDVEGFGPLTGDDFGFDFAEAEENATAVTVDG